MAASMTDESDSETVETVAEHTARHPLVQLLGDSPRIRILAVLLEAGEPLNPTRIYERAGVAERTWYNHVDALEASGIMVQTGQAGNSPLYALARDEDAPDGDDRVECLEKLADWTATALRDGE